MSMIGNFVAICDTDYAKLMHNQDEIEAYLYPDGSEGDGS